MDKQTHPTFEIDPMKETRRDKIQQLIILLVVFGLMAFTLWTGAKIVIEGFDLLAAIKGQVKIIYLNDTECITYWERGQQIYPKLYPDADYKVVIPDDLDLSPFIDNN
jgi:hypothetical protein